VKIRSLLLFYLVFGLAYSAFASSGFFIEDGSDPAKGADQVVYSKNPEANAFYIQGLDYLNKGRAWLGGSVDNAKTALKLFRQASKKDPQFALAYLGQADALDAASFSAPGSLEPGKVYREQEAAALKAIALDDSLTGAHSTLAAIYHDNEYDWPKAEREMKRVIELTPNAAVGHIYYGLFLGTMGRFEEAEAQIRLAQTLDEKSASPNRAMMQVLYWEHKDDAAVAQGLEAVRKSKALNTHFFLGLVYIHQGNFEKGIEELKLASEGGDAGSLAGLAYAYAMAGDKTKLKDTLERFQHHPARDHVPYRLAAVYVALGDKDRAISLIEKDYRQRSNWLNRLKVDPVMDPLRQEPRFKQLMRKMNFEQKPLALQTIYRGPSNLCF
jgi:tetratricopeptide (TPR) repeat protein